MLTLIIDIRVVTNANILSSKIELQRISLTRFMTSVFYLYILFSEDVEPSIQPMIFPVSVKLLVTRLRRYVKKLNSRKLDDSIDRFFSCILTCTRIRIYK